MSCPDEAQLAFQFRDSSLDILDRLEKAHATAGECASTHRATRPGRDQLPPWRRASSGSSSRRPPQAQRPHRAMPSGAGHDAMTLAKYVPSAMLFVPSIGGHGHHVSEDTAESDSIILGAQVMLDAIELFAQSPDRP